MNNTVTQTRWETLLEVFAERAEAEREMRWRRPGFDLVYNWIVGIAALAVIIGLCVWGAQIGIERRDEKIREAGRAEVYAQQAAAEQAAADEEAKAAEALAVQIDQEADALARLFFGIRMFEEKYSYTETDLRTYARSAFNRADATGRDLTAVIYEKGQYVACSEHNTVLNDYKQLGRKLAEEWHAETEKPCDLSYQYAELLPQGIFLKTAIDGPRWRATA